MAEKLGIPVQVLQRCTTSKEFLRWRIYFRQEINQFNPLYYYLAHLASILAKVFSKDPDQIKLEDFLLKFEERGKEQIVEKDPEAQKAQAAINKQMLLAGLGAIKKGSEPQKGRKPSRPNKKTGTMRG